MHIPANCVNKVSPCIFITHKLMEIFEIANRVTVLRDGKTAGTFRINECSESELIARMVGRELTDFYAKSETRIGETALEVRISMHMIQIDPIGSS